MVGKDGCYLFDRGHVQHASRHVFDDLFTTIVETRWRYNVGVCVLIYALSWLVFALAWWLLATLHGDTDLDDDVIANRTSCVAHVTDFQSAFLFSVETQHTIGTASLSSVFLLLCQHLSC
jgi:Inward rectifier potassium channel transmembrane domain